MGEGHPVGCSSLVYHAEKKTNNTRKVGPQRQAFALNCDACFWLAGLRGHKGSHIPGESKRCVSENREYMVTPPAVCRCAPRLGFQTRLGPSRGTSLPCCLVRSPKRPYDNPPRPRHTSLETRDSGTRPLSRCFIIAMHCTSC